jgi:hypothetical protein
MVTGTFNVRPVGRDEARRLCKQHPHAPELPNTSKWYLRLDIDGKFSGFASWGYGVNPADTPNHLFENEVTDVDDYLELNRFFVTDDTEKNTASKFLSINHKILKKHTSTKWLYTYAAGFQGLNGTIYQAANYDYIGPQTCNTFVYVPGKGLVHSVSLYFRFGDITGSNDASLKKLEQKWGEVYRWVGPNFRYIYWLCDDQERQRLLKHAKFQVHDDNPKKEDIDIYIESHDGTREPVPLEKAKEVPVIKLKS